MLYEEKRFAADDLIQDVRVPQRQPFCSRPQRWGYRFDPITLGEDKVLHLGSRAAGLHQAIKPLCGQVFLRRAVMEANTAVSRWSKDAAAEKRAALCISPLRQYLRCIERAGRKARVRVVAGRPQCKGLSKCKSSRDALCASARFLWPQERIVRSIWVDLLKLPVDTVLDHFS